MKKLIYIFVAVMSLQNVSLKAMEDRESICTNMHNFCLRQCIQADVYFGLHATGLTPKELVIQAHKVRDPIRMAVCKAWFPKESKKLCAPGSSRLIENFLTSPTSVAGKHFKKE